MPKQLPKQSVVIIGGGLTGGLLARQLTARNVQVVVLERGGDVRRSGADRLPTQRDELRYSERTELTQDWSVQTYAFRHTPKDEALPLRRVGAFLPGEGVGGSALHWDGQMWRWTQEQMRLRSHLVERYGKNALPASLLVRDLGVSYADLEPYYDAFEKLFGISGKAGNLRGTIQEGGNPFESPRQNEFPQPPLAATETSLLFAEATRKLGFTPFPQPAANSSGHYVNPDGARLAPCQYCGHCERFMCESQAKASPEQLLYPILATRKQFTLREHSHVLGIDYDRKAKRVRGVRYLDLTTGEELYQPADVVALCAFTIPNNALLLQAGLGRAYDPRSGEGILGKHLCYQTMSAINLFFKDRWFNPFMQAGASYWTIDDFNNDNFDHAKLGFFGGANIRTRTAGRPIGAATRLPSGTPRWGTAWKKAVRDGYQNTIALSCLGSSYGHPNNYIDLDPTYTDAFGLPLSRLTFDFPENEVKMSAYITAKAADIAKAMGPVSFDVKNVRRPFDSRVYQTTHITGGTVMGEDPQSSVVSTHLQHWDAENLFVVGGSVLPQNSGHNLSGTLAALALRLGDDMVRYTERPGRL